MAFRSQRRITLAPRLRLNLSKRGLGLSVGPRGVSLSVGSVGCRSCRPSGTGLAYRQKLDNKDADRRGAASPSSAGCSAATVLEELMAEGACLPVHLEVLDNVKFDYFHVFGYEERLRLIALLDRYVFVLNQVLVIRPQADHLAARALGVERQARAL
ncbi:DUF4236 domain-containing protein [Billgrantia diversa]|nr:DUF4236 domain-containing protein [Halomonas sp. MCCC 1A13316]QOR40635.1 DUF4236 domain-containing protein [Halomonas sp. MCCC 1A13316]